MKKMIWFLVTMAMLFSGSFTTAIGGENKSSVVKINTAEIFHTNDTSFIVEAIEKNTEFCGRIQIYLQPEEKKVAPLQARDTLIFVGEIKTFYAIYSKITYSCGPNGVVIKISTKEGSIYSYK